MRIYGNGVLKAPGSERIVHDFVDGPFDTLNPAIIDAARQQGFSIGEPLPASKPAVTVSPAPTRRKAKKRARGKS